MQDFPIFARQAGFDAAAWRRALTIWHAHTRRVSAGNCLIAQGDKVRHIFVVQTGRVHVVVDDYWGNRSVLSVVEPGHIFGAAYAFGQVDAYPISAIAAQDSVITAIPLDGYLASASTAPELYALAQQAFLHALATRSVGLLHSIEQVKQRTLRRKILAYLSHLAHVQGNMQVVVPFSRQEMADYLAVDRTALSRELAALKAEGLIDYRKNRFTLYLPQPS